MVDAPGILVFHFAMAVTLIIPSGTKVSNNH
jgi:hypothetical protein